MLNRHKTITLDITNDFVNEINDSKNEKHIMTTYIAIRDMQNDLITTTIFPKADASGVAYVEPLDGEDELSKNAVKNAMEKFGNHISCYYEVMRDMRILIGGEGPKEIKREPCGAYTYVLPEWMEKICQRAIQINPNITKGDAVLGWTYGSRDVKYPSMEGLNVIKPFAKSYDFSLDDDLEKIDSSVYHKELEKTYGKDKLQNTMMILAISKM